ncbi:hypothetical protein [Marinactinospora rubrisoli]|uniref:Transposase n=1 Tax=Marinactinospora rubrisoli TaxID=2715399 RepID=A0ABW2KMZ5_9ACTN
MYGTGFAGAGIEKAAAGLGHVLIRPARRDQDAPGVYPGRPHMRIEAVIRTPKNQPGPQRHQTRTTEGLWARTYRRIPALNTAIRHNRLIEAPVKHSLVAHDH